MGASYFASVAAKAGEQSAGVTSWGAKLPLLTGMLF